MKKLDYVTQQRFERFVGSLIDLESLVDWISTNFEPEEVFSDPRLRAWAVDNDFEPSA